MADLTIKAHDTWPPLVATLSDTNGPIDLTAAPTVTFLMKGTGQDDVEPVLVTDPCQITDAPNGLISYTWGPDDTAVIDLYDVEFQINWPQGVQTVPNSGYSTVQVMADLGP